MNIEELLHTLFSSIKIQGNDIATTSFSKIEPLPPQSNRCADTPDLFHIFNLHGACSHVLHVSSDLAPQTKADEARRILTIEEASTTLSTHILKPVCHGFIGEKSFAIYPQKQGFNSTFEAKIRKLQLRSEILQCLMDIAEASCQEVPANRAREIVFSRFTWLTSTLSWSAVQAIVEKGKSELENGNWHPRFALDHNDVLYGNIVTDNKWPNTGNYYFTNWVGANTFGFGVHDILSFSISAGYSKAHISKTLSKLADKMEVSRHHLIYQYMLSMGELSVNLNDFPVYRYAKKIALELDYLTQSS